MSKTRMLYNPPPNWPVAPKGFSPPPGWQPDPSWGPAPGGWPIWIEKKKHTARNVILAVITLIILAFAGCSALLVGGINSAVKSTQGDTVANAKTCEGKTYPDQQAGNDHCADASGEVTIREVIVTATPLERDAQKNVCTKVSYTNKSAETVFFNPIDWKIQSPTGEVQDNVFAGSGDLSSGQLIKGGQKSGTVCFDPITGAGQFVLIYKPSFLSGERGIWLNTVK